MLSGQVNYDKLLLLEEMLELYAREMDDDDSDFNKGRSSTLKYVNSCIELLKPIHCTIEDKNNFFGG